MRAPEAKRFSNISADTAPFNLYGGTYRVTVVATFGGGNVGLQQLGPDGSTYLTNHTALTVNGASTVNVPPGMYKIVVVTATGVYVDIARCPGE